MAEFLTTKEFAALVKVSPSTLRTYRRKGLIGPAGFTPGGHPRYLAEQANELLNTTRKPAASSPTEALVDDVLGQIQKGA